MNAWRKKPSMNVAVDQAGQHQRRLKFWTFRGLAILLGLTPLLVFEAVLRATHWRPSRRTVDPFVEFQSERPLFVADDQNEQMVTAANRLEYFRPESFAINKSANEFRIVCAGGSTVQGRPYAIETSFTTWLELSLQAADTSRSWEVINCGGVSYASYRIAPIILEMLRYEPDLIILYTGHNEFLEDRTYGLAKNMPGFVAGLYRQLGRLKTVQYGFDRLDVGDKAGKSPADKDVLATEVDALLDHQGGLQHYHRDLAWRQQVTQHFEFNLRRIIDSAQGAGVSILVVDPPTNLRDCPPFKSEHSSGLSADQIAEVEKTIALARDSVDTDRTGAIALLEQAVALDPDHAGIRFQLGSLYALDNRFDVAKKHLLAARDEDICPLRITRPLSQTLRRVAMDTDTPCVEARNRFEQQSKGTIPGDNLFFDHVHPSFRGHQLIATEILKAMQALEIVVLEDSWQARRDELFTQHWNTLDPVYFARGKQRLQGLQRWTQGRAEETKKEQSLAPTGDR